MARIAQQWLKYCVYALLALNVVLFFSEEWRAVAHTFDGRLALSQVISAFAASIDTAAWVLLLLLFEIETYQIGAAHITPKVGLVFRIMRAGCYGVILYAFYGYLAKAVALHEFVPAEILVDPIALAGAQRLAWVDVINSSTWILVVALLEIDVWLQARERLGGIVEDASKIIKVFLYCILLGAAIYWGIAGPFLDFWDAVLWLFAFVFIELNVFGFERDTESPP
ncbi:MAG: hypothetical protein OXF72_10435 [Gammaproteobacteria bacterium]|nr:hypothetical protein [Gammaproteobacteria bacterium]MCY4199670.1 hypothetical protein [Gammaproteobacteria bacterium]MCY4322938.1 hypothetical protein [Gammaproteobacteria bacterium]